MDGQGMGAAAASRLGLPRIIRATVLPSGTQPRSPDIDGPEAFRFDSQTVRQTEARERV
jgi:hypothetical protein